MEFKVCVRMKATGKYEFRQPEVMSRKHLENNLNRMMNNGRIDAWKIYDGRGAESEWHCDRIMGCF